MADEQMMPTSTEVKPRRKSGGRPQLTQEQFIERSRAKHGERYDYSKAVYTRTRDKVTVICPDHGEFRQGACEHMAGQGCMQCAHREGGNRNRKGTEKFVAQAIQAHGRRYDYSLVDYTNAHAKVTIVCAAHGPFEQSPHSHRKGQNCPKCGLAAAFDFSQTRLVGTEGFIARSREKHGLKFDYSLVEYLGNHKHVRILCPKHGEFKQAPVAHMAGSGCFRCAADAKADKTRRSLDQFIEESRAFHGDKYDYSRVEYRNIAFEVEIVCPIHGPFMQKPAGHMGGHGCIKCSSTGPSNPEMEIAACIEGLGFDIKHSDRKLIRPYELDIVVPSSNLAVEYNGFYWHCDLWREPGYSKMKHDMAFAAGVDLVTIWEFDWKRERTRRVWSRMLAVRLGMGVLSDEFRIVRVAPDRATAFLRKNHLRAVAQFDAAFGLVQDEALVSVLTMRHRRANEWGIAQWASSKPVVDAEKRLFPHAVSELGADLVWCQQEREIGRRSDMRALGFEMLGETPPTQRVWFPKLGLRQSSFWSPSNIPKIMQFVPPGKRRESVSDAEMVEFQNSVRARRIYDAGHIWWVWRR